MGETAGDPSPATKPKPKILVPPRVPVGFLFANGSGPGFSPGPMTLVSSLFPEQGPFSFSQLLAGAMASPNLLPTPISGKDGIFSANSKNSERVVGQNSSRPMSTAVAAPPETLSPLFMVPPGLSPSGYLSPLQSPFGMSHQQALAHVTAQAALSQSFIQMQSQFHCSSSTEAPTEKTLSKKHENQESSKTELSEISQSGKRNDKRGGDGYNWRKYGQKHVKNSECPRSYYKCTHLDCPVKKKVEKSLDGVVLDITYKGQHNHDILTPNNKRAEKKTGLPSQGRIETDKANNVVGDRSIVLFDGGGDERVAKKRSLEIEAPVSASTHHQSVGEAKIVLQTRSEVDLLDDGYKWRKYGQKVVKGNPHPRSYYRCTYAGCNVRKHVERASADPKAVVTTYEGKHNHEIPIGRYISDESANRQLSKTRKKVPKKPMPSKEMDYEKQERNIPTTLHLKDEHITT
ncbi:hypothetical protein ABFS83_11G115400 [Erythranthe nasuta]